MASGIYIIHCMAKWIVAAVFIALWVLLLVVILSGCDQRTAYKGNPTPPPPPPVRHSQAGHEPKSGQVGHISGETQSARWRTAKLKTSQEIALNKAVMLYLRLEYRYQTVAKVRRDGVPAPVIFCLHYRESDNSFKAHLHNGDSLLARTHDVPRGRLPLPKKPPFQWEESAEDALYVCDHLQGPWADLSWSLNRIEGFNGFGYRKLGVPSPYLYSGTNLYRSGKYTSDGHYNQKATDQQLGVVAILLRMKEKGINICFAN
jgi:lysozyme family protein